MRGSRLRVAYLVLYLSLLSQVFCPHLESRPAAGQSIKDEIRSTTYSSFSIPKAGDAWRNASNIVEPRKTSSHEKRLTQQPTNQGGLAASSCTLNESVLAAMHDTDKAIWLVDDSILSTLDGNIQSIINCTKENDVILLETYHTLRPQSTLTIPWNLTLSGYIEGNLIRNGTLTKAKDKVKLTCRAYGPLIVARTSSFALANVMISGCNTATDIVLLESTCTVTQSVGQVQLVHVDFSSNSLSGSGSLINGSRAFCTELSLEDVEFNQNSCDGEGCVLLSTNSTFQDIRVLKNRKAADSSGDCSMFSTQEESQVHVRNMSAVQNEIRILYIHDSTLTVGESSFEGNMREQSSYRKIRGGVVFADQSSLSIWSSMFKSNYAAHGGAIYASSSELKIRHSNFHRNNATNGRGGAIRVENRGFLIMHDTNVTNNVAKEGGALHATTVSTTLVDGRFTRNYAEYGGACVFSSSCDIQVERVIFAENHASNKWGGAICMSNRSRIIVNNSAFQKNSALRNGGAIDASFGCRVNFTNVTSVSNTAGVYGGSLNAHTNTEVVLLHSNFSNNQASNGGAIRERSGAKIMITDSHLIANRAQTGGFISMEDSELNILHSILEANDASKKGGAIFSNSKSGLNLTRTKFARNSANEVGGALYATSVSSLLSDVKFTGNHAFLGGACAFFDGSTIEVKQATFDGNEAQADWGGAIAMSTGSNITVRDSFFENNLAHDNGGAVEANTDCQMHLETVISKNNTSKQNGGSIHVRVRSKVVVSDSSFSKNEAFSGGAVHADRNSTIRLSNTTFNANKADYGGCISAEVVSNITILQSAFKRNDANKKGGAIFIDSGSILSLVSTDLTENSAQEGGALHSTSVALTLRDCQFATNNADSGGACMFKDNSLVHLKGVMFHENHAYLESGGAIDVSFNTTLYAYNLTIRGNEARNHGGGISVRFGSFLNASTMLVVSNSASKLAGGVGIFSDSHFLCYSCLFENNVAMDGAGIYVRSMNKTRSIDAQLQDCQFVSNSANASGGGLMFEGSLNNVRNPSREKDSFGRIVLLNTSLVNNFATHFGSAIISTNIEDVLVACRFEGGKQADFLSQSYLSLLATIDPERLCKSWKGNRQATSRTQGVVGTFGKKLSLSKKPPNSSSDVRLIEEKTSRFVLKNVLRGQPFPFIRITVVDDFGNGPAPTVPRSFSIEITSSDQLFREVVKVTITYGTGSFSGIPIVKPPGTYTLNIDPNIKTIKKAVLNVHVRICRINEAHAEGEWLCQTCGENWYNFNPTTNHQCLPCPDEATCQDRYIIPKDNYWHKGPCQANITHCIVEEACVYDNREKKLREFGLNFTTCETANKYLTKYEDILCNKGYKGPLCGNCANGYGLTGNLECLKCGSLLLSVLRSLSVILYLLVGTVLTIKGTLLVGSRRLLRQDAITPLLGSVSCMPMKEGPSGQIHVQFEVETSTLTTEITHERTSSQVEEVAQARDHTNQVATNEVQLVARGISSHLAHGVAKAQVHLVETWKILINFFQVTSTATMMDVKWTKKIIKFFNMLSFLGAATINSISQPIDCIVSSSSISARAIWRFLFNILVPTIIIAIVSIYWFYCSLRRHRGERSHFLKRLALTVITVTYITYFDITKMAVSVFNCVDVYDDEHHNSHSTRYWIVDTSIECYKSTHNILMGISLVVLTIVSICFPLTCSCALFKTKDEVQISTSRAHETLGLLCGPFKRRFVFWECVTMLKKALLSIIIVFSYPLGNQAQGLLTSIVLVFFLSLHTTCYPFKRDFNSLNYYESGSLLISCITYIMIQFFNDETLSENARTIVSVALIILNGGYVLSTMFLIVRNLIRLAKAMLLSNNVEVPDNISWISIGKLYLKNRKFFATDT